ncbi:MAG TPA: histidine--tRNA ligase, partial [Nannocystaceae bacterium]|nr:histidine--tRNA ligase [Nannocystaceae bacterium]
MAIGTKPPSGMRDFLPADVARRNHVVGIVREVYERYGFAPLETSAIENLEILLGKYGEDEKLVYRILHRGEGLQRALAGDKIDADALSDLALRYDLTVPLARVVAQYSNDLPKFFKRYQIQPVWRADRPGKGRFREFFQCDVDITGTQSVLADAEVCAASCEILDRLGFRDCTLAINHRELLRGLIRAAGIATALEGSALTAVDKLDKIGRDGVQAELEQRGVEPTAAARLLALFDRPTDESNADRLAALRDAIGTDETARAGVDRLGELLELLAATKAGPFARIDPTLARGLGYYTGAIFEARVPDLAGSIAGGGRYDELVGIFGKRKVPAVGLSLGLERILVVMAERGMYPELATGPQVLLCWLDVALSDVLAVAQRLRAQGLRVETYPEPAKLGKQMQYADSPGVRAPWCAILGKDELAR